MIAAQSTHRIDIVVPIYNAPDDVRRCVESVLSCTPEPHRLILIDDASTDAGVRDVLREIQQRGDRHVEIVADALLTDVVIERARPQPGFVLRVIFDARGVD